MIDQSFRNDASFCVAFAIKTVIQGNFPVLRKFMYMYE